MHLANRRAISTLVFILLMIICLVIGGVVSYMFTIAAFVEIPQGTTITITNVYIDKENATSFEIGVLNPSYSPASATITRIAISLKGSSQLYDIVETEPTITDGMVVRKGESLNITCLKVQREGTNVTWGKIAAEFAGETIIVHVFSSNAPAANMELTLPYVKLDVTEADFDSKVSFRRFNITIANDASSETNLTIRGILVPGIDLTENDISPTLPQAIVANESVRFNCTANWKGLGNTTLTIFTEQGYEFSESLQLPLVQTTIQSITIDENYTDYFNVTIFNAPESANYVNVTKIVATLENETTIERDYSSRSIISNSTEVFTFDWTWREYRGKDIAITAYFLQDFETSATAKTPPKVIIKVLNEKEVFNLKAQGQFNITLLNHQSSLSSVNITRIVSTESDGSVEEINDTEPQLPYGFLEPGNNVTFYCNITRWTGHAGENLTLTIYAIINETLGNYTFPFTFTLPFAALNITNVLHTTVGETEYLTITVENPTYSLRNLTISKVTVTFENQTQPLEQVFPENQIIVKPGTSAYLLCAFDLTEHIGKSITVIVTTVEGIEVSWQGDTW